MFNILKNIIGKADLRTKRFFSDEEFAKALKPGIYLRTTEVPSHFPIQGKTVYKVVDVAKTERSICLVVESPESAGNKFRVDKEWFERIVYYKPIKVVPLKIEELASFYDGKIEEIKRDCIKSITSCKCDKVQAISNARRSSAKIIELNNRLKNVDKEKTSELRKEIDYLNALIKSGKYKNFKIVNNSLTGITNEILNTGNNRLRIFEINSNIGVHNGYIIKALDNSETNFCLGNIRDTVFHLSLLGQYGQFFELVHEFLVKQQRGEFVGM